jgi:chromate reductase
MKVFDIAVLVGSLRKESINRKVAQALIGLAPATLNMEIVGIGDLALYNEDVETAGAPSAWTAFRDRLRDADGVLFVTPEYNRSVPAVLKNAIDVGSRPPGKGIWNGKPGAVVSASPGAIGGFGANHHLRQSLVAVGVQTMAHPEMYLGGAGKLFDADGRLVVDATRDYFARFLQAFASWVARNVAGAAA